MNGPGLNLVVERIVLDGITLPPEQASALARLVEDELRLLASGGGIFDDNDALLLDVKPITLLEPPDLPALARVLARRIAAEVRRARVDHER